MIAYLGNLEPEAKGYTAEDIVRIAQEYKITRILKLKPEQLEELMKEMWDLNVLTSESGYYNFATEGFRDMLGGQQAILDAMQDYVEEGEVCN